MLHLVFRTLLVLILIPVVLMPVYGFVRPVSTLMIYERLTGVPVERIWVPLDDIAPSLRARRATAPTDEASWKTRSFASVAAST
jgi:hypothetical protein